MNLTESQWAASRRLEPRMKLVHSIADRLWTVPGGPLLASLVAKIALPPLSDHLVCPTTLGFDLCISPGAGENYYRLGFYESGTLHVMRAWLRPGDVFVDAGCSVGQMTVFASRLVGETGRVLAFEPDAVRHRDLLNSIALNESTNVTPFELGLGEEEGEALLFQERISPSMIPKRGRDDEAAHRVPLRALDSVLEEEAVAAVRMVKVDVEGFEADVLLGARKLLSGAAAPMLCIEHGVYQRDRADALAVVRDANDYAFYELGRTKKHASRLRHVEDRDALRDGDNVFCLLPRHVEELTASGVLG